MTRLKWQEVRVLQLVAEGLQNREIAERLSLTEGTVKWYMQGIFQKLGVRRRALAVKQAQQIKVLEVSRSR